MFKLAELYTNIPRDEFQFNTRFDPNRVLVGRPLLQA
jgi:hypothetical protein